MQMINTDQAIFDAIVAAVRRDPVLGGTVIDVQKFIDTFNGHRDRKLCTSIDSYEVTHLKAMLANEHQKTVPVEDRNRIAQSAPETHGPLPSGEVDLTVMSDCSGAGAAQTPPYPVDPDARIEGLLSALREYAIRFEKLKGVTQAPDGADGVAAYERGFKDGVLVGREMPGVAKLSSDSEALALLIEGSDGLAMMRHEGPVQLGVRKTAMVIAALRGIAQTPAYASRIEALEAALREIDNMAPATCEVTLAHQMADIASAALRKVMAHDDD